MPYLDVSSILLDPDFADRFTVIRRIETVGQTGRSSTSNQTFPNIVGVITAADPTDLERREDFQSTPRLISIVTKFKLQGEVKGRQPDLVSWIGDNFLVKKIDIYTRFGTGFIQAICESIDRVDTEIL